MRRVTTERTEITERNTEARSERPPFDHFRMTGDLPAGFPVELNQLTARIIGAADGIIIAEVKADPRRSPYLAIGDLPSGLCLLACCTLAIIGFRARRRNSATA